LRKCEASADEIRRRFQAYRDEDKHECNLLSNRVNALVTSQSLFAAGAAALYIGGNHKVEILFVAIAALVMNMIASFGIVIGCRVLTEWHRHGQALIARDEGGLLLGYRLARRVQPDWQHIVSMNLFSIGLPAVFGVVWLVVIASVVTQYVPLESVSAFTRVYVSVFIMAALSAIWWGVLRTVWDKAGGLWE